MAKERRRNLLLWILIFALVFLANQRNSWGQNLAREEVVKIWGVKNPIEVEKYLIETEDGRQAEAVIYFVANPKELAVAKKWLVRRNNSGVFLGDIFDKEIDPESRRIAAESLLGEQYFATVVLGPGGEVWWSQSGIPLTIGLGEKMEKAASLKNYDISTEVSPSFEPLFKIDGERFSLSEFETSDVSNVDVVEVSKNQKIISEATSSYVFPVSGTGWYHYPGSTYHYPNNGWFSGDDTYAIDLNKGSSSSSDCGEPVRSIVAGVVKQVSTTSGWVLIEHPYVIEVKGVTYSRFYAGNGHMRNVLVRVGQTVSAGQKIGEVSNLGGNFTCHLHHVLYVGKFLSTTNNKMLYSFNPALLGGPYVKFNYDGYIFDNFVDDKNSSGNYVFTREGDSTDWFTSSVYGIMGQMSYTRTSVGANKARWEFLDGVSSAGNYRIYAFIPRNFATSTLVPYSIYGGDGTVSKGKVTVNQYIYSDYWLNLATVNFSLGEILKIRTSDSTGESVSKYLGADIIRRFKKTDIRMNQ